ncbi:MAG: EscF/YscF/HrpA family type III secretion system needle major subunit [Enterobacteriaceae bacterium]
MNFTDVVNQFNTQLNDASTNISTVLSTSQVTDPQKMLEQQYLYQNFVNMVAFDSAITKALGDSVSGIIAKMPT